MEAGKGPKTPLQIRLDAGELAALDTYIARFTDFPPSRVDVLRKALNEWLAQKLDPPQAPQRSITAPDPPPTRPVPRAADVQAMPVAFSRGHPPRTTSCSGCCRASMGAGHPRGHQPCGHTTLDGHRQNGGRQ